MGIGMAVGAEGWLWIIPKINGRTEGTGRAGASVGAARNPSADRLDGVTPHDDVFLLFVFLAVEKSQIFYCMTLSSLTTIF